MRGMKVSPNRLKGRRLVRLALLSELKARVVLGATAQAGQKQVSTMIRVKDEEEFPLSFGEIDCEVC